MVANRQNEFIKVLSIIATIFLPLTMIAGIFGMNFNNMPELDYQWLYYFIVATTALALGFTLWLLWLGRWVVRGRRKLNRFVPTAVDPVKLANYMGNVARARKR